MMMRITSHQKQKTQKTRSQLRDCFVIYGGTFKDLPRPA